MEIYTKILKRGCYWLPVVTSECATVVWETHKFRSKHKAEEFARQLAVASKGEYRPTAA